jgi:hypothetical protein
MLTAKTSELELTHGWLDSDPEHARVRATFPINKWAGSADSAVVYFEIKPGDRLAEHTDSAEEILYGRVRARRGHSVAIVATARKLACLFWCLLSRQEDYAYQQPSLTAKKLRLLEVRAGSPSHKGLYTGTFVTRERMRAAERELAAQAESAYKRMVAE